MHRLRSDDKRLNKKPTTAELIDFIWEMKALGSPDDDFRKPESILTSSEASELKTLKDRASSVAETVFASAGDDISIIRKVIEEM